MSHKIAVIVTAAGSGTRLNAGVPKAAVEIQGSTILEHALNTVVQLENLKQLIVTVPRNDQQITSIVQRYPQAEIVSGGATRQESVAAGLAHVKNCTLVLVHDAARCFTPYEVFARVLESLANGSKAVIPVLPVVDTIKRVKDSIIIEDVPRDELGIVQTPQGFSYEALCAAHAQAKNQEATDDAMLASNAGFVVYTVRGDDRALKITRPFDIKIAEALLKDKK